jgi:hypothetical protein
MIQAESCLVLGAAVQVKMRLTAGAQWSMRMACGHATWHVVMQFEKQS